MDSTRRARFAALLAAGVALALAGGCAGPAVAPEPAPEVRPPAAPAAMTTAGADAWLDGLVPAALERTGIAGAAVAVVHDGRVLTTRGFGYADTGTDGTPARPVDPDRTLFRVGSVSKVATATAAMQLVEQGRIDLDADVSRYLDVPVPRRFDAPVTMRNLLTHTAGFEERVRGLIHLGEIPVDLRATLADPPEQVFAPGTTPAYSNYGYALAGYVVQRVSGVPFETYVQREVLDRAGTTSSTFAQPLPPALADRLSGAYPTVDAPAAPFETVPPAPAGALTASATDMGRLMLALLGEPGPGRPLLSPSTRTLMERPALGPESLGTLAGGPRMALGLFDDARNGHRILGHGGDTQFFHAQLTLFPDDRTGVFVVLNGNGRDATDTLELRDAVTKGFADRFFPAQGPTVVPAASSAPGTGHAAMAQGSYVSARGSFSSFLRPLELATTTTVTARPDGTVQLSPDVLSPRPAVYREVRPWVWREVGGQRTIAMRPSADGTRVEAIGFESAFTLLRAQPMRDAALMVPVLLGSLVVLLGALVAWPVGAAARRHYGAAALDARDRPVRAATRTGVACALLAVAGWAGVITVVMGLQDVPSPVVVAVVVLQWLALAATVPAAAGAGTAIRRRAGAWRVTGRVLVLLALAGVGYTAIVFGLLTPSLSY